jgi:hypothetical protein
MYKGRLRSCWNRRTCDGSNERSKTGTKMEIETHNISMHGQTNAEEQTEFKRSMT